MAEIRTRANTYILDEEDDAFKRRRAEKEKDGEPGDASPEEKRNKERGEGSRKRDKKVRTGEKAAKEPLYPKRENFERRRPWHQADPRRREVKATHAVEEGEKEADPPRVVLDKTKWCEYHRSAGHDTGDCFTLKNEIKRLIRAGRSQMNDRGYRWNGERQQVNRYKGGRQQDDRRRDDRRRMPTADKKETLATRNKGRRKPLIKTLSRQLGQ
ncbi:uncharacterized protein LOC130712753 [Lotus japonicus]|uniref:uncharacterized protein LOC130712753 n=1 Tax=Lotus japonicus TaxID=34305 RepID=UPI002590C4F7|nr:uncharacterized protein LOC130712753 [Lotus japonicus]